MSHGGGWGNPHYVEKGDVRYPKSRRDVEIVARHYSARIAVSAQLDATAVTSYKLTFCLLCRDVLKLSQEEAVCH